MELKVMTLNLRTDVSSDGINCFAGRRERILECIRNEQPDLIGFQEARTAMREWLADAMAPMGYTITGCGRDANYRGEGTPIAYKRDRLNIMASTTIWLSATPLVPGSRFKGDQSNCPRVFTAVTFKPSEGRPFIFLNTHLDHQGSTAKLLGAIQIDQYLSRRGMPFVVSGDMNAGPESPAIKAFTDYELCGRPVIEATAGVGGTFHGYGRHNPPAKIDYIFTDMPCDSSKSYVIHDEPVDGVYISDHMPVCAFVNTEN